MINANELRIGNYLEPLFCEEPFCKVRGIDEEYIYSDCISTDYTGFDEFKPIILTEEWLLKMGFSTTTYSEVDMYTIKNKSGKYYFCCDYIGREFKYEIQFVHQLQNLYFALTQKELFYNPNEEVGNTK